MTSLDPNDSEHLNALVQECTDKWPEQGDKILDALCVQHPSRAKALRRRISVLQRTGLLDAVPRSAQRLGDFRLLGQLGSGGMGVVYRAEQVSLQREVALKVIRPDQSFFAESRQRFLREANAIARLQHPGIVPVHMAGEERGVLYYAMDLVPGCTLAQVLEALKGRAAATLRGADMAAAVEACALADAPGSDAGKDRTAAAFAGSWVECCLRLVRAVAEALEHAHLRGVLHRDVKPSNVMLMRDGRVMLLDFGLASTDGDARITRSGAQVGSLAYMAPEQVRGDVESIGCATDVYGAGVLLYELLALRQPFLAGQSEATRQAVLAANPAALRAMNRAVATDVELVCRKAIDPEPLRRYASAGDLARDLGNVLELRPIDARAPNLWLRGKRVAQRHPVRALALAFAGVLLLGVFPALYVQQRTARVHLQAEQERTSAALATARAALTRAEAQEQRARWGLGKAREAVDRFLADIGKFRAVDIPLLEQLRRDTLEQAATLYEQLLQDPDGARDGALALDHARTLLSLSQVLRELTRYAEAEPVLQRVVANLDAQASIDPARQHLLASARAALGSTLLSLDRLAEAEVALTQSGDELRALANQQALSAGVQTELLRNRVSLANLRRQQKQPDAAGKLFEEAIAVGEGMPRDIEVLRVLAEARRGLAMQLGNQSASRPAEAEFAQVVALRREIAARAPSSARFRSELARALQDLGGHIRAWFTPRLSEALTLLDESAELCASLVRDFPQQSSYRVDFCRTRIATANVRQGLRLPGDAARDLRVAIDGLEAVRQDLPREAAWRSPLVYVRYQLARHLQHEGDDVAADAELALAQTLLDQLRVEAPQELDFMQQQVELLLARSDSKAIGSAQALALSRAAFELGLGLLAEHMQDARLYGSAFRAFEHHAAALAARGEVTECLAVADAYRAAQPYKWLCQLTLARTYLHCRELLTGMADGGDAAVTVLRQKCLDDAREAVRQASKHSLRAVLKIEDDAVYAPLRGEADIEDLLRRAREPKG